MEEEREEEEGEEGNDEVEDDIQEDKFDDGVKWRLRVEEDEGVVINNKTRKKLCEIVLILFCKKDEGFM